MHLLLALLLQAGAPAERADWSADEARARPHLSYRLANADEPRRGNDGRHRVRMDWDALNASLAEDAQLERSRARRTVRERRQQSASIVIIDGVAHGVW